MGLESDNLASLDGAAKQHNQVQEYRRLRARCHAHDLAVRGGIMFGFDADDTDVLARTVAVMGPLVHFQRDV